MTRTGTALLDKPGPGPATLAPSSDVIPAVYTSYCFAPATPLPSIGFDARGVSIPRPGYLIGGYAPGNGSISATG